jgi:hypothetical protein
MARSKATTQSILSARKDGLFRGAGHRAALCAEPLARNDDETLPHVMRAQPNDLSPHSSVGFERCCSTAFAQQSRPVIMGPGVRRGDGGRRSGYARPIRTPGLASGPALVLPERNVYVNGLPAPALCPCAFSFLKIRGRSRKILWLLME